MWTLSKVIVVGLITGRNGPGLPFSRCIFLETKVVFVPEVGVESLLQPLPGFVVLDKCYDYKYVLNID